jgi:hypothetical protein
VALLTAGTIGRIHMQIPWRSLGSSPIVVTVSDILLVAAPLSNQVWEEEEERKLARIKKRKQLDKMEQQRLEDAHQTLSGGDTFTKRLLQKILDNIVVNITNVHICYEDSVSLPEQTFTFGISLESLILQKDSSRGDENESTPLYYKVVELSSFTAYLNPNPRKETLLGRQVGHLPLEAFKDVLRNGIHRSDFDPGYETLLMPLQVVVHAAVCKRSEQHLDIPGVEASVNASQVSMTLGEAQYDCIVNWLDFVSNFGTRLQFLKVRPAASVMEAPASWWKFALAAVLKDLRSKRSRFDWAKVARGRVILSRYVKLWKRHLLSTTLNSGKEGDPYGQILVLEEELELEDILAYRKVAELELETERELLAKELQEVPAQHEHRWYHSFMPWSAHTVTTEEDALAKYEISEKDRDQLFNLIDFNPNSTKDMKACIYPSDYVTLKLSLAVSVVGVSLSERQTTRYQNNFSKGSMSQDTSCEVLFASLEIQGIAVEMTKCIGCMSVEGSVKDLVVQDFFTPDACYPRVVGMIPSEDESVHFLRLKFENTPLKGGRVIISPGAVTFQDVADGAEDETNGNDTLPQIKLDSKLTVKVAPLQIISCAAMLVRTKQFFKDISGVNLDKVQKALTATYEDTKKRTSRSMLNNDHLHRNRHLDISIDAPIVLIPKDIADPETVCVVAKLGLISLTTDYASMYESLQTYSKICYDDYHCHLSGLHFSVAKLGSAYNPLIPQERRARIPGSGNIVERFAANVYIQKSVVSDEPSVRDIGVSIHIEDIVVNIVMEQYRTVMDLLGRKIQSLRDPKPANPEPALTVESMESLDAQSALTSPVRVLPLLEEPTGQSPMINLEEATLPSIPMDRSDLKGGSNPSLRVQAFSLLNDHETDSVPSPRMSASQRDDDADSFLSALENADSNYNVLSDDDEAPETITVSVARKQPPPRDPSQVVAAITVIVKAISVSISGLVGNEPLVRASLQNSEFSCIMRPLDSSIGATVGEVSVVNVARPNAPSQIIRLVGGMHDASNRADVNIYISEPGSPMQKGNRMEASINFQVLSIWWEDCVLHDVVAVVFSGIHDFKEASRSILVEQLENAGLSMEEYLSMVEENRIAALRKVQAEQMHSVDDEKDSSSLHNKKIEVVLGVLEATLAHGEVALAKVMASRISCTVAIKSLTTIDVAVSGLRMSDCQRSGSLGTVVESDNVSLMIRVGDPMLEYGYSTVMDIAVTNAEVVFVRPFLNDLLEYLLHGQFLPTIFQMIMKKPHTSHPEGDCGLHYGTSFGLSVTTGRLLLLAPDTDAEDSLCSVLGLKTVRALQFPSWEMGLTEQDRENDAHAIGHRIETYDVEVKELYLISLSSAVDWQKNAADLLNMAENHDSESRGERMNFSEKELNQAKNLGLLMIRPTRAHVAVGLLSKVLYSPVILRAMREAPDTGTSCRWQGQIAEGMKKSIRLLCLDASRPKVSVDVSMSSGDICMLDVSYHTLIDSIMFCLSHSRSLSLSVKADQAGPPDVEPSPPVESASVPTVVVDIDFRDVTALLADTQGMLVGIRAEDLKVSVIVGVGLVVKTTASRLTGLMDHQQLPAFLCPAEAHCALKVIYASTPKRVLSIAVQKYVLMPAMGLVPRIAHFFAGKGKEGNKEEEKEREEKECSSSNASVREFGVKVSLMNVRALLVEKSDYAVGDRCAHVRVSLALSISLSEMLRMKISSATLSIAAGTVNTGVSSQPILFVRSRRLLARASFSMRLVKGPGCLQIEVSLGRKQHELDLTLSMMDLELLKGAYATLLGSFAGAESDDSIGAADTESLSGSSESDSDASDFSEEVENSDIHSQPGSLEALDGMLAPPSLESKEVLDSEGSFSDADNDSDDSSLDEFSPSSAGHPSSINGEFFQKLGVSRKLWGRGGLPPAARTFGEVVSAKAKAEYRKSRKIQQRSIKNYVRVRLSPAVSIQFVPNQFSELPYLYSLIRPKKDVLIVNMQKRLKLNLSLALTLFYYNNAVECFEPCLESSLWKLILATHKSLTLSLVSEKLSINVNPVLMGVVRDLQKEFGDISDTNTKDVREGSDSRYLRGKYTFLNQTGVPVAIFGAKGYLSTLEAGQREIWDANDFRKGIGESDESVIDSESTISKRRESKVARGDAGGGITMKYLTDDASRPTFMFKIMPEELEPSVTCDLDRIQCFYHSMTPKVGAYMSRLRTQGVISEVIMGDDFLKRIELRSPMFFENNTGVPVQVLIRMQKSVVRKHKGAKKYKTMTMLVLPGERNPVPFAYVYAGEFSIAPETEAFLFANENFRKWIPIDSLITKSSELFSYENSSRVPNSAIPPHLASMIPRRYFLKIGVEKSIPRMGTRRAEQQQCEWAFHLVAPLQIRNALPVALDLQLLDSRTRKIVSERISHGEFRNVYEYDMLAKVWISLRLGGFVCESFAVVNESSSVFDHLSLDLTRLLPFSKKDDAAIVMIDRNNRSLRLKLKREQHFGGAIIATIFCDFWIINKLDVRIYFKQHHLLDHLSTIENRGLAAGLDYGNESGMSSLTSNHEFPAVEILSGYWGALAQQNGKDVSENLRQLLQTGFAVILPSSFSKIPGFFEDKSSSSFHMLFVAFKLGDLLCFRVFKDSLDNNLIFPTPADYSVKQHHHPNLPLLFEKVLYGKLRDPKHVHDVTRVFSEHVQNASQIHLGRFPKRLLPGFPTCCGGASTRIDIRYEWGSGYFIRNYKADVMVEDIAIPTSEDVLVLEGYLKLLPSPAGIDSLQIIVALYGNPSQASSCVDVTSDLVELFKENRSIYIQKSYWASLPMFAAHKRTAKTLSVVYRLGYTVFVRHFAEDACIRIPCAEDFKKIDFRLNSAILSCSMAAYGDPVVKPTQFIVTDKINSWIGKTCRRFVAGPGNKCALFGVDDDASGGHRKAIGIQWKFESRALTLADVTDVIIKSHVGHLELPQPAIHYGRLKEPQLDAIDLTMYSFNMSDPLSRQSLQLQVGDSACWSGNCDPSKLGQATLQIEKVKEVSTYWIAANVEQGTGIYSDTRFITLHPKFILINNTGGALEYRTHRDARATLLHRLRHRNVTSDGAVSREMAKWSKTSAMSEESSKPSSPDESRGSVPENILFRPQGRSRSHSKKQRESSSSSRGNSLRKKEGVVIVDDESDEDASEKPPSRQASLHWHRAALLAKQNVRKRAQMDLLEKSSEANGVVPPGKSIMLDSFPFGADEPIISIRFHDYWDPRDRDDVKWDWSEPFSLSGHAKDFAIMQRSVAAGDIYISDCELQLQHNSTFFVINEENRELPPYSIVNTMDIPIFVNQDGVSIVYEVAARESMSYTWDAPDGNKLLAIRLAVSFSNATPVAIPLDSFVSHKATTMMRSDGRKYRVVTDVHPDGPIKTLDVSGQIWSDSALHPTLSSKGRSYSHAIRMQRETKPAKQLSFQLNTVHLSLISREPREIATVTLKSARASLQLSEDVKDIDISIQYLQIDNQSLATNYPAALFPLQDDSKFLQFTLRMRNTSKITFIQEFRVEVEPFVLQCDLAFMLSLEAWYKTLQRQDPSDSTADAEWMDHLLNDKLQADISGEHALERNKKIYFETFCISALVAVLTFSTNDRNFSQKSRGESNLASMFSHFGLSLLDVDKASFTLGGLSLEHPFVTTRQLNDVIKDHYKGEVIAQMLSLLNAVSILGIKNPVGLLSNLADAIRSFDPASHLRIRPPRYFGPDNVIQLYNEEIASCYAVLYSIDGGKYRNEVPVCDLKAEFGARMLLTNRRLLMSHSENISSSVWSEQFSHIISQNVVGSDSILHAHRYDLVIVVLKQSSKKRGIVAERERRISFNSYEAAAVAEQLLERCIGYSQIESSSGEESDEQEADPLELDLLGAEADLLDMEEGSIEHAQAEMSRKLELMRDELAVLRRKVEVPSMAGWLSKKSHKNNNKEGRRYFVLHDQMLSYYKNEKCRGDRNLIPLFTGVTLTMVEGEEEKRKFAWSLKSQETSWVLIAESREERDVWMRATHQQRLVSGQSQLSKEDVFFT